MTKLQQVFFVFFETYIERETTRHIGFGMQQDVNDYNEDHDIPGAKRTNKIKKRTKRCLLNKKATAINT